VNVCEEMELIAGAGDADDALDLMRRVARAGKTPLAVAIRRTVQGGQLDSEALLRLAEETRRQNERQTRECYRLLAAFTAATGLRY